MVGGRTAEASAAAHEAYLAGRVAGLCREGALELAADAAHAIDAQAATGDSGTAGDPATVRPR